MVLFAGVLFGLLSFCQGESRADLFDFSFSDSSSNLLISGTVDATLVSGNQYLVSDATITTLNIPILSASANTWVLDVAMNPQYIYPGANPTLDVVGINFVVAGDTNRNQLINLFYGRNYVLTAANFNNSPPNDTADYTNGTFTLTQATPEPASLFLLGAGVPCMMVVRRLRGKRASV